jgi:hypothetical protein
MLGYKVEGIGPGSGDTVLLVARIDGGQGDREGGGRRR